MGWRTGKRRPVTHRPQSDRIERSAPVLRAGSGRWTPFRASLLSNEGGRRIGVPEAERLRDRCVERPVATTPRYARAAGVPIVRHGACPLTVRPVVRSARPSIGCGRAVARGLRAIGSAMRVVKVRYRREPEREPAPALQSRHRSRKPTSGSSESGGDRSLPGYAFRALDRPPTITLGGRAGRINACCVPFCVPSIRQAGRAIWLEDEAAGL